MSNVLCYCTCEIVGGVMALWLVALVSRSGGESLNPGRGHCIVFLGKTVLSQCLSPPKYINGYW